MITLLRDIYAFAQQLIPSPVSLFIKYRFSPVDLAAIDNHIDNNTQRYASSSSKLATFDVLSYNINNVAAYSPTRRRQILRAIFTSGADIILLQETNQAWEDLLRDDATALQFQYNYFHHPGTNDRAAGGIAILSQYPLENVKILNFSRDVNGSVFPALICQVKIPIQSSTSTTTNHATINIANIHLRPPVNLDGSAWFDTARLTEPIRINEVKELIQRTQSERTPTTYNNSEQSTPLDIIAGDFNEGDMAGALSYLASLGYIDTLQQHVPRHKETHTWPFMRNMCLLRKRLDHILWHNNGPLTITFNNNNGALGCYVELKCHGCGVVTGYENGASDHQPVISRFAIMKR